LQHEICVLASLWGGLGKSLDGLRLPSGGLWQGYNKARQLPASSGQERLTLLRNCDQILQLNAI